jgi:hypothetical protein
LPLVPPPLGVAGLAGLVGLAGRLGALPGVVEPPLCWPGVPLVPDEPELPEAELPPPEAERSPSRLHPDRSAPLSANRAAATNAVNFILTSAGLCPLIGARNGP